MDWYKHYMGDYAGKTARLTMLQHGAYRLLIDNYYAEEKPLPKDHDTLYRIAGAFTAKEREAVDYVVRSMFEDCEDGYRKERIDLQISQYRKQAETNRQNRLGGKSNNDPPNKPSHESKNESSDESTNNTRNQKPETRFKPPTVETVEEYCRSRGNNIDSAYFVDYYTARDWKLKGGSKMKDWRASVRTWEKNNFENDRRHSGSNGKQSNAERVWNDCAGSI